MPPQKVERTVQHEAYLAQRIRVEREERGWSLERLAGKMTDAGCPMDRSAIYKTESAGRRITVDEAVTFANVFGLPLSNLLLPPDIAKNKEAIKLYRRYMAVSEQYVAAAKELDEIQNRLLEIVDEGYESEVIAALQGEAESDSNLAYFDGPDGLIRTWRSLRDNDARIKQSLREREASKE